MNWWSGAWCRRATSATSRSGNAARLHAGMNPRFFDGTPAEAAVATLFKDSREAG